MYFRGGEGRGGEGGEGRGGRGGGGRGGREGGEGRRGGKEGREGGREGGEGGREGGREGRGGEGGREGGNLFRDLSQSLSAVFGKSALNYCDVESGGHQYFKQSVQPCGACPMGTAPGSPCPTRVQPIGSSWPASC